MGQQTTSSLTLWHGNCGMLFLYRFLWTVITKSLRSSAADFPSAQRSVAQKADTNRELFRPRAEATKTLS